MNTCSSGLLVMMSHTFLTMSASVLVFSRILETVMTEAAS